MGLMHADHGGHASVRRERAPAHAGDRAGPGGRGGRGRARQLHAAPHPDVPGHAVHDVCAACRGSLRRQPALGARRLLQGRVLRAVRAALRCVLRADRVAASITLRVCRARA